MDTRSTESKPVLVAVAGPTASGKTELALRLAERFDGEIVNCDSVQVYRGFDIGTAKLPESERRGIPHHLIDILDAEEVFTAGEFARRARTVVAEIAARGRMPVLAGGTGFYLRALLDGLSPCPQRDDELRERLAEEEERSLGSLHRRLAELDPATAERIHPNDVPKTMRAVEICLMSRRPASAVLAQARDALTGFRVLKFGLFPPREELYQRIEVRTRRMFEAGLVAEVEGLLARGVSAAAKPFESLGYRQALGVVCGEMTVEEAVAETTLRTRQYAKRQMTWFRRESELHAVNGFGDQAEVIETVTQVLAQG